MATLLGRNPAAWSVRDVCDWLEFVGLGRHRKAFVHQGVSGALLPKLNEEVLKSDFGLNNLGQRETLLQAIRELLQHAPKDGAGLGRIASAKPVATIAAPGSTQLPGAANARLHEHRMRLRRDLEKAEARAAQLAAATQHAQRNTDLAQKEVARLQDALKKVKLQAMGKGKGSVPVHLPLLSSDESDKGTDDEEEVGKAGSGPAPPPFFERLQADLEARRAKKQQGLGRTGKGAPPHRSDSAGKENDGDMDLAACLQMIKGVLGDKDPQILVHLTQEEPEDLLITALHDAAAKLSETIGLAPAEVTAIKAAAGAKKKAQRLEAGVKTALFMRRLEQDLATRGDRTKELRQRWAAETEARAAAKEQRDMADARIRFRALGWPEDGAWEETLRALLNRAKVAQKARAEGKAPDWEACRNDGLLQYAPPDEAPASAAPAAAGDGVGASLEQPASSTQTSAAGGKALTSTVELLSGCREDELDRLNALPGPKKVLAVHRAIKTQQFLKETRADLNARSTKLAQAQESKKPAPGKKLKKEAQQAFLERLAEDAARRARNK